jgi:lipopolysaccharide assembly protein A
MGAMHRSRALPRARRHEIQQRRTEGDFHHHCNLVNGLAVSLRGFTARRFPGGSIINAVAQEDNDMSKRNFFIALVVAATGLVLLFMLQNLESVTVSFVSLRFTMPLSMLLILIYLLGMISGSAALALVKGLVAGVRRTPGAGHGDSP